MNSDKTFDEVLASAKAGDAQSQCDYALMLELGLGMDQDLPLAFSYYQKSAEQGHAKAQYNLGVFYALGKAGEKDITKAKHWIKQAHENGYSGTSIF